MKKVLFYINTLSDGGAERVISNLANYFFSKQFEVVLVTSYETKKEYELADGIKRYCLMSKRSKLVIIKNLILISKLKSIIKNENPDLVVSFMREANYRAILASKRFKKKCVISVRNDPSKEYAHILDKFLVNRLYKKAHGIVFQTQEAKSWFCKEIQRKSIVIPNFVNECFFNVSFESKRRHIVSVGRIVEQKNYELLIRSFSEIASKTNDNLIIYGDGPLKDKMIALTKKYHVENRIVFKGFINNISDAIKSAKVFVLTSNYEGMPNCLMEAMAMGLPCVATDCPSGGPRSLIENGFNGLLVPVGDQNAIEKSIITLLNDETFAKRIGRNAKQTMEEKFNCNIVFNQWLSYFESVLFENDM